MQAQPWGSSPTSAADGLSVDNRSPAGAPIALEIGLAQRHPGGTRLSLDARPGHHDSGCGRAVTRRRRTGATQMSGNGYEFLLTFAVPGSLGRERWIDEQLETCCGDARASRSGAHLITLRVLREDDSAHEAMVSAIADVRRAVPLARLVEAGPDYVGLSDIAAEFDVARQTMRKLLVGGLRPAPLPVHEGHHAMWRLALVLGWLREEKHYPVDDALDETAWAAFQANEALAARFSDPVAQAELAAVLDLPRSAPLNPWRVMPERPRLEAGWMHEVLDGAAPPAGGRWIAGDASPAGERW